MGQAIAVILVWLSLGSIGLLADQSEADKDAPVRQREHYTGPIGRAGEEHKTATRRARGVRFNNNNPRIPTISDSATTGVMITYRDRRGPRPLPLDADLIVIGTLEATQSFLSDDRKEIYTEDIYVVDDVLKGFTAGLGQEITVLKEGGAVRLPKGGTAIRRMGGQYFPAVGSRVCLFLQSTGNIGEYALRGGVRVDTPSPVALDESVPIKTMDPGTSADFIATVRAQLATDGQQ
jgi:hypothetical protein